MCWGKLQGVQEPGRSKTTVLKNARRKAPVQPIGEECDRKFASPQRHTPGPRINNDFITLISYRKTPVSIRRSTTPLRSMHFTEHTHANPGGRRFFFLFFFLNRVNLKIQLNFNFPIILIPLLTQRQQIELAARSVQRQKETAWEREQYSLKVA